MEWRVGLASAFSSKARQAEHHQAVQDRRGRPVLSSRAEGARMDFGGYISNREDGNGPGVAYAANPVGCRPHFRRIWPGEIHQRQREYVATAERGSVLRLERPPHPSSP